MAIKTYNDQNFVAIANAIRAKNGETTQYKPSEMAPAIMAIESGLELLPQDTAAGAIVNFPDGSNNYPVVELIANIDPKQAGSGDPAPDNVRPISGFTSMNIIKVGSNLWAEDYALGFWGANGSFSPNATGYLSSANHIRVNPNTKYRFVNGGNTSFYICYYDADKTFIRRDTLAYPSQSEITTPANCYYVNFSTYQNYGTVYNNDISLNYPSSDTSYHSHIEDVKTISWESEAGTVYGGTLNVTTGELTVTRKSVTFNGSSSENWGYNAVTQGNLFRITNQGNAIINANNTLCNSFKPTNVRTDLTISGSAVGYMDFIHNSIIGDTPVALIAAWRNYLAENNIQVVFSLTTPEVYQVEPEIVKTLLGVNNIYADTGDVEVTYRADIDLYIAKKIAEGA